MINMTIKETYKKLQKTYKLPKFEDINSEFEITTIENKDFLLREIRRKIAEKIQAYIKILEGLMQPEPTITNLHEIRALDEKEQVYQIFKGLMILERTNIETSVDENDKKTADFINHCWKKWSNIKKKLLKIIQELKKSWEEESELKEELSYMG